MLRDVFACSTISFFQIEGAGEAGVPRAQERPGGEGQDERHRRVQEFLADVAVEAHELIELHAGRMGALDGDVGLSKPIRHQPDRLHLGVREAQRARANLRMPQLPACPTEDGEADDDQKQTEDGIVVTADRARGARGTGHLYRLPPPSALARRCDAMSCNAHSRAACRFRCIACS